MFSGYHVSARLKRRTLSVIYDIDIPCTLSLSIAFHIPVRTSCRNDQLLVGTTDFLSEQVIYDKQKRIQSKNFLYIILWSYTK